MTLKEQLGDEWYELLKDQFKMSYMLKLSAWLKKKREVKTIYPESLDTFKAFRLTPFNEVKAIIIGQDPYYDGTADGLAFSYKSSHIADNKDYKKSLDIIWDELEDDIKFGLYLDFNYNLEWLAEQGVFLINSILTVDRGKPLSHKNFGWEIFVQYCLKLLIEDSSPRVFLLWGSKAKNLFEEIYKKSISNNNLILTAPHPAYDLRVGRNSKTLEFDNNYPNTFRGCKHFSKTNDYLKKHNLKQILW